MPKMISIPDYEPIDLSDMYNAGKEIYTHAIDSTNGSYLEPYSPVPPTGLLYFHGIPFQIGPLDRPNENCFIFFNTRSPEQESTTISIHRQAQTILFAHAVLATRLWQGSPLGLLVARYRLLYTSGDNYENQIRERFEIGTIPLSWGHYPFLAFPDQKVTMADRFQGLWKNAGFRLTEIHTPLPEAYYIWSMENPYPDQTIESIEIIPEDIPFVLAGITLGHIDETPLIPGRNRFVKISLINIEEDNIKAVSLEIDRGTATYVHSLPVCMSEVTSDQMKGFGIKPNPSVFPAYSTVSAVPSAKLAFRVNNRIVASFRWRDLLKNPSLVMDPYKFELLEGRKNWIKITVRDSENNKPIPCRIAILSEDGIPFQPGGHHNHVHSNLGTWNIDVGGDVRLGQMTYAYIDGSCEGWMPRGRCMIDLSCGFEYQPIRKWVNITDHQRELTLQLERIYNMNSQGYFSGDTHVHFISTQGALLEAQAEGLNVINLLQTQWGHHFSNTEDFTGKPQPSHDGKTIVFVSQENRQHVLGHLSLLGLHKPIFPWCTGGSEEAEVGGDLDTTLCYWADAAHQQEAIVILPHFPAPNAEAAALIATGRVDAVEMVDFLPFEHLEYYRYLNAGYRLPLVAGTDKMSSEVPVGLFRTYVKLAPNTNFDYWSWCEGIKAGRTFISSGVLLWFSIDGADVGDTLFLEKGSTVEIKATARSIFPIHTLQIIQNGKVISESSNDQGTNELYVNDKIIVQNDTWLTARCSGKGYDAQKHHDERSRGIMAHTSPIYIACGEQYTVYDHETIQYMLTLIEGCIAYIRQREGRREPRTVTHHHNLNHQVYLEFPFHQAREILEQRIQSSDSDDPLSRKESCHDQG